MKQMRTTTTTATTTTTTITIEMLNVAKIWKNQVDQCKSLSSEIRVRKTFYWHKCIQAGKKLFVCKKRKKKPTRTNERETKKINSNVYTQSLCLKAIIQNYCSRIIIYSNQNEWNQIPSIVLWTVVRIKKKILNYFLNAPNSVLYISCIYDIRTHILLILNFMLSLLMVIILSFPI